MMHELFDDQQYQSPSGSFKISRHSNCQIHHDPLISTADTLDGETLAHTIVDSRDDATANASLNQPADIDVTISSATSELHEEADRGVSPTLHRNHSTRGHLDLAAATQDSISSTGTPQTPSSGILGRIRSDNDLRVAFNDARIDGNLFSGLRSGYLARPRIPTPQSGNRSVSAPRVNSVKQEYLSHSPVTSPSPAENDLAPDVKPAAPAAEGHAQTSSPIIKQESVCSKQAVVDSNDPRDNKPRTARRAGNQLGHISSASLPARPNVPHNHFGRIPVAPCSRPPPNRKLSSVTATKPRLIVVSLPGMHVAVATPEVKLKQYTTLPDHRPSLRRDKPVRVKFPGQQERFIFPAADRSFVFIPRGPKPLHCGQMRGAAGTYRTVNNNDEGWGAQCTGAPLVSGRPASFVGPADGHLNPFSQQPMLANGGYPPIPMPMPSLVGNQNREPYSQMAPAFPRHGRSLSLPYGMPPPPPPSIGPIVPPSQDFPSPMAYISHASQAPFPTPVTRPNTNAPNMLGAMFRSAKEYRQREQQQHQHQQILAPPYTPSYIPNMEQQHYNHPQHTDMPTPAAYSNPNPNLSPNSNPPAMHGHLINGTVYYDQPPLSPPPPPPLPWSHSPYEPQWWPQITPEYHSLPPRQQRPLPPPTTTTPMYFPRPPQGLPGLQVPPMHVPQPPPPPLQGPPMYFPQPPPLSPYHFPPIIPPVQHAQAFHGP